MIDYRKCLSQVEKGKPCQQEIDRSDLFRIFRFLFSINERTRMEFKAVSEVLPLIARQILGELCRAATMLCISHF